MKLSMKCDTAIYDSYCNAIARFCELKPTFSLLCQFDFACVFAKTASLCFRSGFHAHAAGNINHKHISTIGVRLSLRCMCLRYMGKIMRLPVIFIRQALFYISKMTRNWNHCIVSRRATITSSTKLFPDTKLTQSSNSVRIGKIIYLRKNCLTTLPTIVFFHAASFLTRFLQSVPSGSMFCTV